MFSCSEISACQQKIERDFFLLLLFLIILVISEGKKVLAFSLFSLFSTSVAPNWMLERMLGCFNTS